MKSKSWMRCVLIVGLTLGFNLHAFSVRAEGIGMVTGSQTGTYIKFGHDIANVAKKEGVEIIVKNSEGSLDNIRRLRSKENAAIAIVQSDLLGFLSRSEDPAIQSLSKDLKLVFPFYNEEVHLLANKDIQRFEDLEGKRVVVGTRGSGNYLTSNNLLNMLNIKPSKRIELSPVDAVSEVLVGKADAMFYVSGKPVDLFKNMEAMQKDSDPTYAKLLKTIHFVPLNHEKMLQEYTASTIGPEDYGWVTEAVPTIAVKAVLVSYDFSAYGTEYYQLRCNQIARVGRAVRGSLDQLKQTGHPKWNEVKLDEETGIWEWDTCSRNSISDSNAMEMNPENLQETIKDYLKGNQ